MISYLEFMERLTQLNKNVNDFFTLLIRKKNYPVTTMELLLLIKLKQNDGISPAEIAKKGSHLFNHLQFLLNSLENKHLISITAKSLNDINAKIALEKKGRLIADEFKDILVPQEVLNNLETLEIYAKKMIS